MKQNALNSKFKLRNVRIRSRHPSHNIIRKGNQLSILYPKLAIVRLGSTTYSDIPLFINSITGVKTSSNKLAMKRGFNALSVQTPEFWLNRERESIPDDSFPIIAKRIVGSRGRGIKLFETKRDMLLANLGEEYYYEKYYNYTREYRLHCSVPTNEVFYTCRKMLKRDAPEDSKFCRNDNNCVWFVESNPEFNKPANWNEISEHAIKAVKACGLDMGAVDVRVKGKIKDGRHDFQIIEVNSAPSFGERDENGNPSLVSQKYNEYIPKILRAKDVY